MSRLLELIHMCTSTLWLLKAICWCQRKFFNYNKLQRIWDKGRIFYMNIEIKGTWSGINNDGENFSCNLCCSRLLNTLFSQNLSSLTLLFKKVGLRKQAIVEFDSFHAAYWHPTFQMTVSCHIGTCDESLIFAYKYPREQIPQRTRQYSS